MEDAHEEQIFVASRFPPQKSVEGWIIYICGIHIEASEDDIQDLFSDYGKIKNLHFNLDRKTCSNKGYALIEYEELSSAENAIKSCNGRLFMDKMLNVDFAFRRPS